MASSGVGIIFRFSRGEVVMPQSSRDELVDQTSHLKETALLARALLGIGSFFTAEEEAQLCEALDEWVARVGVERMPAGLSDLRVALLATRAGTAH